MKLVLQIYILKKCRSLSVTGLQLISYTFFVPENSAFVNLWPQDTADPFVIDSEFRRDVLLNHFVRQRIYDRDLVDGKILQMANNRTAKISRKGSQ